MSKEPARLDAPASKPTKPIDHDEPAHAPDRRGMTTIATGPVPEGDALAHTIEAIEHVVNAKTLDKLGQVPAAYQVHVIRLHAVMTLGTWNGKRLSPDEQLALFQHARAALVPVLDRFEQTGHPKRVSQIAMRLQEHDQQLTAGRVAYISGGGDRTLARLGEWTNVAANAKDSLASMFEKRQAAVQQIWNASKETDPPSNSIWESLAIMAVTMVGSALALKLVGLVADKVVGLSVADVALAKTASRPVTPRMMARELLETATAKGVEKAKEPAGKAFKDRATVAARDDAGSTSVKDAFFMTQLILLAEQKREACAKLNANQGSLWPHFLEDPDGAVEALRHVGAVIDKSHGFANALQLETTAARYMTMLAGASLGTIEGNLQGAKAKRDASPFGFLIPEGAGSSDRPGIDLGAVMDAGITFDKRVPGLISLQFELGDPDGEVAVTKAWASGVPRALRVHLQGMRLAEHNIPFRAHSVFGGVSFGRNENGEIWAHVADAALPWCEKKAKTRDGAKDKAARIVLVKEIGAWTLKGRHGVELEG